MAILFHHYKELEEMVERVKNFKNGISTNQLNRCPRCKRGVLETTRNEKVRICDNCGWAKIEMTMADYEELFKEQKMIVQQRRQRIDRISEGHVFRYDIRKPTIGGF